MMKENKRFLFWIFFKRRYYEVWNYWISWLPNRNVKKIVKFSNNEWNVSKKKKWKVIAKILKFLLSFNFLLCMLSTCTWHSGTEIAGLMKFLHSKLSTQWWYKSTHSIFYFYGKVTDLYTCSTQITTVIHVKMILIYFDIHKHSASLKVWVVRKIIIKHEIIFFCLFWQRHLCHHLTTET